MKRISKVLVVSTLIISLSVQLVYASGFSDFFTKRSSFCNFWNKSAPNWGKSVYQNQFYPAGRFLKKSVYQDRFCPTGNWLKHHGASVLVGAPTAGIGAFIMTFGLLTLNPLGLVGGAIGMGGCYLMYRDPATRSWVFDENEGLLDKGNDLVKQGDYDQAISTFTTVIEDGRKPRPRSEQAARTYVKLGEVYEKKGNLTQAISEWTNAIQANGNDPQAYCNRAGAYYQTGEYDKAWNDVHKIQSLGYKLNSDFTNALKEASGIAK